MSPINKMHPRNIYNSRPDFIKLAKNYPEFEPFVTLVGKSKYLFQKIFIYFDFVIGYIWKTEDRL